MASNSALAVGISVSGTHKVQLSDQSVNNQYNCPACLSTIFFGPKDFLDMVLRRVLNGRLIGPKSSVERKKYALANKVVCASGRVFFRARHAGSRPERSTCQCCQ